MKKLLPLLFLVASSSLAQAAVYVFTVNLSGANEATANNSSGTGAPTSVGSVNFDDVSKVFSVSISYSGLSANATASHIHGPAAPGVNAPVWLPLTGTLGVTAGTFSGSAVLTTQQQADLFNGLDYANIHTTAFPGGEIRGQILNPTLVSVPSELNSFRFADIGTQTVGIPFSVVITALDSAGNSVSNFTGMVDLTTTAGTITPTTSAAFVGGVITQQVTVTAAGTAQTISATANGKTGTSGTFTVNLAGTVLNHFAIGAITSPQIGGTPFPITITAQDANNNTVTNFTGPVTFTITPTGPISTTIPSAFVNGIMTNYVTLFVAGPAFTITVTSGTVNGTSGTFAVASGTKVVTWGDNSHGQCTVPSGLSGVAAITAGQYHSLALQGDGTVVAWGMSTLPNGLSQVTAIEAGIYHSLALKSDGTVVAWGANYSGETVVPSGLSGVSAISAGYMFSLALNSGGTVVAWGRNDYGQCTVPSGLNGVKAIAACGYHSLALKSDGTVMAWGWNNYGQSTVPSGLKGVIAVAGGDQYCLALKGDGTVVGWGNYPSGQVPSGLNGVTAIAAGCSHSLALKGDGTVVAWGYNSDGQSTVPNGLSGVMAISAGWYFNMALLAPDELNSFRFTAIGTQTAGTPFNVVITAVDGSGNTVSNFTGRVVLTTTVGAITPAISDAFVSGSITQQVTFTTAGLTQTITATGSGKTGTSDAFNVNPGALTSVAVVPASLHAGALGNATFNFTTASAIPAGGQMVVVFPTGFNLSGASGTASSSVIGLNGTWTATVAGQTLILTQTNGTATSPGPKRLVVGNIQNPASTGIYGPFAMTTETGVGAPIDSASAPAIPISSSLLTGASITPASLIAGTVGNVNLSITSATTIPNGGKIKVMFPSGFDASGATITATTGLTGTWVAGISGQVVTCVQSGGGATASGAITLTLGGIRNPQYSGSAGSYIVFTTSPTDALLDVYEAVPTSTFTAAPMLLASITPVSLLAGATNTVIVSFTNANPIPADGKIIVTFPSINLGGTLFQFDLSSVGANSASIISGLDGSLSVAADNANHMLTITRSGGTAALAGAGKAFSVTGIKNPTISGVTGAYGLETTLNDGAAVIDTGNAPVTTITAGLLMGMVMPSQATNITVPGTSDPWLAGMPNGSQDNVGTGEPPDAAPNQSPVFALSVTPGQVLNWFATGQVGHPGDIADPDGAAYSISTRTIGANNGISDIRVPIDSLLGVFVSGVPGGPAPATLDFSTPASRDYSGLCPVLQQAFFLGNGLTSSGAVQSLVVPAGATELFLGTMDGYGWSNNIGSFAVNVAAVLAAGTLRSATINFVTSNPIPNNGQVQVTFPAGFDLIDANGLTATSLQNLPGTWTAAVNGQTITLTMSNGTNASPGAKSLTIAGIRNPTAAVTNGIYTFTTLTSSGDIIDQGSTVAGPSIPYGQLAATAVIPGSLAAGNISPAMINCATVTLIPAGGKINVVFPTGFAVNAAEGLTSTSLAGLTGTWTAYVTGQIVTLVQSDGGATAPGALSLSIGGIRNPLVSGSTGTYTIFTSTSSDALLDVAVGVPVSNITAPPPPSITNQPQGTNVVAGSNVSFSVTADGTSPLNYQWQFNGVVLTNSDRINGVSTPTLTITNVQLADAGTYRVVVNNTGGATNSVSARLSVSDSSGVVTTIYNLNTSPTGMLDLLGSSQWMASGGSDSGGYLVLTRTATNQQSTLIFDDFNDGQVVKAFSFSCDLKIGDGTASPADGFSLSFVRNGDPVLLNHNGHGFATGPNNEADLPEEGTQTGLSIGFDCWQSGSTAVSQGLPDGDVRYDCVGLSIRVENRLVFQLPLRTLNGAATNPNSLQTGPRLNGDGTNPALTWQPLRLELNSDGLLNVWWKGTQILSNFQTGHPPTAGRFILSARTGGSYQLQAVDNIRIATTSADKPCVTGISADPSELFIDIQDGFSTFLNTNSLNLLLDGNPFSLDSLSKTGLVTRLRYLVAPRYLICGSTHQAQVSYQDSNGNALSGAYSFMVTGYPFGWLNQTNFVFEAEDFNFNGGSFIDNPLLTSTESLGNYINKVGVQNIDRYDANPGGSHYYRSYNSTNSTGELVSIVPAGDFARQKYLDAQAVDPAVADYAVGSVDLWEWWNYTRTFSAGAYKIYARLAPTASTFALRLDQVLNGATNVDQVTTPLGKILGGGPVWEQSTTGSISPFRYYPVIDVQGNEVVMRLAGPQTLRFTQIAGGFNVNYYLFAPVNNPGALPPYIASATPYPGAIGVVPDGLIHVVIADRDSRTQTNSIQLLLNGTNITSSAAIQQNTSGVTIDYLPPTFLTPGSTNTITLSFNDDAAIPGHLTNNWSFITASNIPTIPTNYAQPVGSGNTPGFTVRCSQQTQDTTTTTARTERQLAGQYPYLTLGFDTPQVINYWGNGPAGDFPNNGTPNFPGVIDASNRNFIALEAIAYLDLKQGAYTFGVASDDGFRASMGAEAHAIVADPIHAMVLGEFNGGRSVSDSLFSFLVPTNGLYPLRFTYMQGTGGYVAQFFSLDPATSQPILINDPNNPRSIKAYRFASGFLANVIQITQQPVNVTVAANENSATFTSSATAGTWATPYFFAYQWQKNGQDIPGALWPSYTIPVVKASDAGAYRCNITLLGYPSVVSADASLSVLPDTHPPLVVAIAGNSSSNTITLRFSEPVDPLSAGATTNYSANGNLNIIAAALDANDPLGKTVILMTSPQITGAQYILTINGVKDLAGNLIAPNTTATFNSLHNNITLSVQQLLGQDWNTTNSWSDGNPASISAVMYPGVAYELLPGSRLRTPQDVSSATFPGASLIVDGDSAKNGNSGQLVFKGGGPGTLYFTNLIMNGGQLVNWNPSNNLTPVIIQGQMTIATNSFINEPNNTDRSYQIDALLTGSGTFSYYHDNSLLFNPNYVHNLNITGLSNTYSGKWDVQVGPLLGSGAGSLGTNDITVGAQGALETLYDLNNPNGGLFLSGRMYLHQNDTFKTVSINGVRLVPGIYTFAQLNSAYPSNFPASWNSLVGSTFSTGSGSLTIRPGLLAVASVIPVNSAAAAISNVIVSFTTEYPIPNLGKISVVFPSGFDVTGVNGQSAIGLSGLSGTWTASVTGQTVTLIQSGGTDALAGAKNLAIGPIRNPPTVGMTETYLVQTLTATDVLIDQGTAPGTVIAPALPAIAVGPASQNFGAISVGTSASRIFYVTNTGGGTLTGSASAGAPFSIYAGGNYSLTNSQRQAVVVWYFPTVPGTNHGIVTFSGGGDATAAVTGVALPALASVTFQAASTNASPGRPIAVPITVAGFSNIFSAQFTLFWNPAVLQFTGTGDYGLGGLNDGNFGTNFLNQGKLTFSWDEPNGVGASVVDGTILFSLQFTVVGNMGTNSFVDFGDNPTPREVVDKNNNRLAFVSLPGLVQVNRVQLAGTVRYSTSDLAVSGVQVNLYGDDTQSQATGTNGAYSFLVNAGGTYRVVPSLTTDVRPSLWVTTIDISLIRRHILAIAALDSPYKILAADVNNSASVTTADITNIRRMILGYTNSFPAGLWTFVRRGYVFVDPLHPWPYESICQFSNLVQDATGQDFVGVMYGDVNNSWTLSPSGTTNSAASGQRVGLMDRQRASVATVTFQVGPGSVGTGNLIRVPILAGGFKRVTSVQFSLQWDPAVLQYAGVANLGVPGVDENSLGTAHCEQGKLAFSWDDPQAMGATLPDGALLFTALFKAVKANGASTTVAFGDNPTLREVSVDAASAGFLAQNGDITLPLPGPDFALVPLPQVSSSIGVGKMFSIAVPTVSGKTYILECTDSLTHGDWKVVTEVVGDGTVKVISDPAASSPQRFYRVWIR